MTGDEAQRIREAAVRNGRRERRDQGIPEHIESMTTTASLAALLAAQDTAPRREEKTK